MESSPSIEPTPQLNPELETFKDRMQIGLQDALDFFPGDDFLLLQPLTLNIEDDERSIDELSVEEKSALEQIIIDSLDINVSEVSFYEFEGPLRDDKTHSLVKVSVFPTDRENLFFHKVTYENGDTIFAVGPQDMKFQ